jgi:hypothetical protein
LPRHSHDPAGRCVEIDVAGAVPAYTQLRLLFGLREREASGATLQQAASMQYMMPVHPACSGYSGTTYLRWEMVPPAGHPPPAPA